MTYKGLNSLTFLFSEISSVSTPYNIFQTSKKLIAEGKLTKALDLLIDLLNKEKSIKLELVEEIDNLVDSTAGRVREIFGESTFKDYRRKFRCRGVTLQSKKPVLSNCSL